MNNIIAAIGGACVGVGSTLVVQKIRKDGFKLGVDALHDAVVAKLDEVDEQENPGTLAYREAVVQETSKPRNDAPVKPTGIKPTGIKPTGIKPTGTPTDK